MNSKINKPTQLSRFVYLASLGPYFELFHALIYDYPQVIINQVNFFKERLV